MTGSTASQAFFHLKPPSKVKKIAVPLFAILLVVASCKPRASKEEMSSLIKEDFYKKANLEVSKVELVRKEDYLYTGFVDLADESQAEIEVQLDKEEPTQFIWKVTKPSPAMVQKAINDATAEMQASFDSAAKAADLELRKALESDSF